MRICLYTSTALPKMGGQEMVVDTLARHFSALGHEATVLAPRHRHLAIDDARLPYPVVRHPRFLSTRRFVAWYRRWLLELYHWNRFDVLHCHDVYPTGYLAALCRRDIDAPVVITSHGGDVREGNVRLAKPGLPARHTLALEQADALIAISGCTRDGILAVVSGGAKHRQHSQRRGRGTLRATGRSSRRAGPGDPRRRIRVVHRPLARAQGG